MVFGTYDKFPLYFYLSVTTCCLIGFHGNHSNTNDVTNGRHLGFFLVFRIYTTLRLGMMRFKFTKNS